VETVELTIRCFLCWTLDLSWSGHTDELKLRYVA
jgi:hypothetical protein